jgi:cytochrome c551/c552
MKNEDKVGPSWTKIRNKYDDNFINRFKLFHSILNGSQGVWGEVPMPANTFLDSNDVHAILDTLYKIPL